MTFKIYEVLDYLLTVPEPVEVLVVPDLVASAVGDADAEAVGLGDKVGLGSTETSGVGVGAKVAEYLPLSQTK